MNGHSNRMGRRRMLERTLGLVAGGWMLRLAVGAGDAAGAKSTKDALLYQDHPHDGNRCSDCKFFTAGGNDGAIGTCAIVDGAIDRNGWCMAFSRRS